MNKKRLILLVIMFVFLLVGMISVYDNTEHSVLMDEKKVANVTLSTLSMMLETKAASGVYEVSSDTSWPMSGYTFNDSLSKCTKGSTLTWDSDNATIVFSGTTADTCYVYFDLIPTIANVCDDGDSLSECIQELYAVSGEGTVGLYYFDGVGDYTNANQEYADYRYIYSGGTDDINNFLCLGDDCTDTDNLYRILGIYLNDDNEYEVKVMKYEYSDSTYGVHSYSSFTSTSIYTYLNETFLNDIGDYSNLIVSHMWYVPGNIGTTYTPYEYVEYESSSTTTFDDYVGLISISDYGYASDSNYWSTGITPSSSWIYSGSTEWVLSFWTVSAGLLTTNLGRAYDAYETSITFVVGGEHSIRPAFYLDSDIKYSSGTGTQSDPIIISS